jgi:hypothetical protein
VNTPRAPFKTSLRFTSFLLFDKCCAIAPAPIESTAPIRIVGEIRR